MLKCLDIHIPVTIYKFATFRSDHLTDYGHSMGVSPFKRHNYSSLDRQGVEDCDYFRDVSMSQDTF